MKNYQLYLDTNGDDFIIQLDYRNTYLLYSMLRYITASCEDVASPDELFLANKIADDIYDFLDDETAEKVFNNQL